MPKLKVTPKNIFVSLLFAVLLFPHLCYFFLWLAHVCVWSRLYSASEKETIQTWTLD